MSDGGGAEPNPFAGMFDYRPERLDLVPAHMREGLRRHIEHGIPTGAALGSVLRDACVREVAFRLDDEALAGLRGLVTFLHNYAPGDCWGSRELVEGWRERGGLRGLASAKTRS